MRDIEKILQVLGDLQFATKQGISELIKADASAHTLRYAIEGLQALESAATSIGESNYGDTPYCDRGSILLRSNIGERDDREEVILKLMEELVASKAWRSRDGGAAPIAPPGDQDLSENVE